VNRLMNQAYFHIILAFQLCHNEMVCSILQNLIIVNNKVCGDVSLSITLSRV
jgi:hypothetical protein